MALPTQVPRQSPVISKDAKVTVWWDRFLVDVLQSLRVLTPAGTFADNAAAIAGGLAVGQVYQTATGEVRVVV